MVCVKPGWKPECWFSHNAAHMLNRKNLVFVTKVPHVVAQEFKFILAVIQENLYKRALIGSDTNQDVQPQKKLD